MQRPNIVLAGTCHREQYTSPQSIIPKRTVHRTREKHAAKLTSQLNTAFEQGSERTAHALSDPGGTYLEFRGQQGEKLATKSLENMQQGIRLLNVREYDEATYATVFIPSGKETYFLKKVEEYG